MIFQLTLKNCRISELSSAYLTQFSYKLQKRLDVRSNDEILLKLTIKKNIDRYFPPKGGLAKHKKYADSKAALAFFEGSISLRFRKNRLYSEFKGVTIDECIKTGFSRLLKEVSEYRNHHFSSESDYPHRQSIRSL